MISAESFLRAVEHACEERGITRKDLCLGARVDQTVLQPGRVQRRIANGSLGLPSLDVIDRLERELRMPPLGLLLLAQSMETEQMREAA